jgi:aminoglycoside phosphotransferase (APT) family kinase protein
MERFHRLAQQTPFITPAIEHAWQQAVAAPVDVPPTWLHGDLHPRNVLVEQGQISGIIDWGDLTAGDCATDLASVWMLFADPAARRAAFAVYGPLTAATFTRAKGWAIFFGAMLLESGRVNSPAHAAMGECVLRRLAEPDADIV